MSRDLILMSSELKDKLSTIPSDPGVYFFKDKKDSIIYIGKAKCLKKRVRSYFNKKKHDIKTSVLIKHIADIDILIVKNEAEALITESNLIKVHKPRYNVFLKDDKTFPYIKISNEKFPKVEIIRFKHFNKDDHLYFGPYTRSRDLRKIVKLLHKVFPLKTCNDKSKESCFCGFCLSDYNISEIKYEEIINHVISFLKGKTDGVLTYLNSEMKRLSEKMEFEKAATLRDQISLIRDFYKTENHIKTDEKNRDFIGICIEDSVGVVTMIKYRNSKLISKQSYEVNIGENDDMALIGFIKQYYISTMDIPKEILIQESIINQEKLNKWMNALGKKTPKVIVPKIGEKKSKIDLCVKNSKLQISRIMLTKKKRKEYVSKMVSSLQKDLLMEVPPRRIEGFDNSNIQGKYPVSSMVCFIDGKPRKSEYRKFKIKNVKGIDDFASMKEVVLRRYKRVLKEQLPLPDLIVIDGGKGQLSSSKDALDSLGLAFIPIIGIAKKMEEVFKPNISEPQNISKTSPGLMLLKRVRDESHRFAIQFHRQIREKGMLQ
ncbi:MAG: excinuclease ABC subunit C [Candidatus Marinimicrobia bacterium]|nr:excinuclease ABC subunit C [Candidatus Neomarinimicrobiota bacterium]